MPKHHPHFLLTACALAVASFLTACASVPTPKGTVAGYSSAEFVPTVGTYRSNELEDSPVVNELVRQAIQQKFTRNGIRFGQGSAELKVGYIIIRQNSAVTVLNDDHFGPGRDSSDILHLAHKKGVIDKEPSSTYDAGALIIDVIDVENGKLIFRDFAKNDVLSNISDAERKQRIEGAVNIALEKFFK